MSKWYLVVLVLSGIVLTDDRAAASGLQTAEIRVRYDRSELDSPASARRLFGRIGDAALESCGASPFSLVEFRSATLASRCWRDAVDAAVRRIDNPLLTAAAREDGRTENDQ